MACGRPSLSRTSGSNATRSYADISRVRRLKTCVPSPTTVMTVPPVAPAMRSTPCRCASESIAATGRLADGSFSSASSLMTYTLARACAASRASSRSRSCPCSVISPSDINTTVLGPSMVFRMPNRSIKERSESSVRRRAVSAIRLDSARMSASHDPLAFGPHSRSTTFASVSASSSLIAKASVTAMLWMAARGSKKPLMR